MSYCFDYKDHKRFLSILQLLLKINSKVVDRSVRWLGNTKETTNFDDLLDGIDIKNSV